MRTIYQNTWLLFTVIHSTARRHACLACVFYKIHVCFTALCLHLLWIIGSTNRRMKIIIETHWNQIEYQNWREKFMRKAKWNSKNLCRLMHGNHMSSEILLASEPIRQEFWHSLYFDIVTTTSTPCQTDQPPPTVRCDLHTKVVCGRCLPGNSKLELVSAIV